jgi:arginine deiminase
MKTSPDGTRISPAAGRAGDVPPVRVESEVGRLRRVLVHEPGPEIDHMVPAMMGELLFDDILHGAFARDEHGRFRRVLQLLGVEILEAQDLLTEVLELEAGRRWVLDRVSPHLLPGFQERVAEMAPAELAAALVGGVRRDPADASLSPEDLFGIRPLPNWCFQRDTQVVLGRGVLFSSMRNFARSREALLSRAVFHFHPSLAGVPVIHDPENWEERLSRDRSRDPDRASLEGGDVLVLSSDVVAVGISERTSRAGIAAMARALHRRDEGPRWLLQVELPLERAYMHLDTLFTPVDREAALVFPPVILPGRPSTARVVEYDLHAAELAPTERGDLLAALSRRGIPLDPIPCGGDDPMHQQREQWTDGANALAVAPGIVVLYDRNVRTAEAMSRRGYRVVRADALLLGAEEVRVEGAEKVCLLTPSNELSRARGGPHCLTHPLVRDPV